MSGNQAKRVAVIGAGTMGRGIAQVFAQSGYDVFLHDTMGAERRALARARGRMRRPCSLQ